MSYRNEGCDKYTSAQIQAWIDDAEKTLQTNIQNNTNTNSAEHIQALRQQLDDLRADLILKKQEETKVEMKQLLSRLLLIVESM